MNRFALSLLAILLAPVAFAQAPTCGITVSPKEAPAPAAVTVTWNCSNSVSGKATGGWSGDKATSGSEAISGVMNTRSYFLKCTSALAQFTATWTAVTTDEGGGPFTVSGYRVYESSTFGGLEAATPAPVGAAVTTLQLWLPPGLHFVGIKAVSPTETSAMSNVMSKTKVAATAECSDRITITEATRPAAPALIRLVKLDK